jgi:hypothetical protein
LEIKVYKAVTASAISMNIEILARCLFNLPKPEIKDKIFEVDKRTGYFTYRDHTQLNSDMVKQNLPKNENEARLMAKDFFVAANAKMGKSKALKKQTFPYLFSSFLKYMSAYAVEHPEKQQTDHWAVHYSIMLAPFPGAKKVLVLGQEVIVKIGNNGIVISLDYNYRPVQMSLNITSNKQLKPQGNNGNRILQ